MTRNILFLTDFSENSVRAFENFLKLASGIDCEVDILHVVRPEIEAADTPLLAGRSAITRQEVATEVMQTFINAGQEQVPEAKMLMRGYVKIGPIISKTRECYEEFHHDLIVLGTRGDNKSRIEKWLGTASSKIIRSDMCNILLIPPGIEFNGISQVAFASALKDSDPYLLWKSLHFIEPYKPIVRWLHQIEDPYIEEKKISSFLTYFNEKPGDVQMSFHRLEKGKFSPAILSFLEQYRIDLLVMIREPKNLWEELFHKSHTVEIANAINIPLLILKEE
ncbi:MAG: universal stress protein [Saprospiraceae bacterium]|nr:universal stress protein [Saprospiraceae bacterium]